MGLYHNPHLNERVAGVAAVDRYCRGVDTTYEQVVSLTVTTTGDGIVLAYLSIDMVDAMGGTRAGTQLGVYPLSQQAHAQEDALLLARKWGLTLRRATPGVGWEIVRNADAVDSTDGKGLIIGA